MRSEIMIQGFSPTTSGHWDTEEDVSKVAFQTGPLSIKSRATPPKQCLSAHIPQSHQDSQDYQPYQESFPHSKMHFIATLSALTSLSTLTVGAPTAALIAKRDACSPEPAGVTGYAFDATSAEGFTGATSFADAANGAVTPDNYASIFSNEKKSNK